MKKEGIISQLKGKTVGGKQNRKKLKKKTLNQTNE